jgi:hypothetical protein
LAQHQKHRLTAEELEIRIWGFVVVMVTLVLVGIVAMLLYSVTFVTQPIKSMAPIDQAYTKMLNDIVLLIVGGIGGIMTKRVTKSPDANLGTNCPPVSTYQPGLSTYPTPASNLMPNFNWMGFQNPELDETWVPPPPPTTSPDYLAPEREEIALERAARGAE